MTARDGASAPETGHPLAALALAALLASAGCGTWQAAAPAPASASAPASPAVAEPATVRRGTFEDRFLLTGELEAVDSDRIVVPRTPVWQVAIRWLEADGAEVRAGQPVLELDNSQFTGDLEQNRIAESQALNALRRKEAELAGSLSESTYQVDRRQIELDVAQLEAAIPKELLAERDWQERQLALRRAEVELAKAEADLEAERRAGEAELRDLRLSLERARAEIVQAERAIEQLTLTAPRAGVLVVEESRQESRKLQVGDTVWVGMTVATIPDLSRMKVAASLSDVDDGRIATGMRVRCSLDAYPDRTYDGTIADISPVAREESNESLRRFFRAEIRLDESDPSRMRPGMSVRAEVLLPPREDVLLAPRRAIEWTDEGARLVLADGSRVEVELGPCSALACVIAGGADEGTRLGVDA